MLPHLFTEESSASDLLVMLALAKTWFQVSCMFVLQGLDMSLCDYDGRTALHLAAAEGQLASVQVLGHPDQ